MRALFFGTPAFAVPSLDALAAIADIAGVVCQPDKPRGRGLELAAPPVKARALELGLSVVQPTKLRTGEFAGWVRAQQADVALVVAYGRILPPDVLAATRLGFVNVHASLLPKYRGAAPIAWAILQGERETGITLMLLDEGMDTGSMLESFPTPIDENETAGALSLRLAGLGARAVQEGLPRFVTGGYTPVPQDSSLASMAPILKKEDGAIDWAQPARRVHDRVRAMIPWPGAYSHLRGKLVKIQATRKIDAHADAPPGQVVVADKSRVVVACGEGGHETVELLEIQLEGKKPVRAVDWHNGRGVQTGDRFEA